MSQPVRFNLSAGTIPEGFCPKNWQEALDTLIALIAVTPNQNYATFVTGSQAPTSDQGPWLKDGTEWFIWDNSLGMYVKMEVTGAFNSVQIFDLSGNYTVPADITQVRVEMWGGGGGGHDVEAGPVGGAGGGGGGYCSAILVVTPGQVIPLVVGTGGASGAPGGDGLDSTFLTATARGGKKADSADIVGAGGQYNGADYGVYGSAGSAGNSSVPGTGGDAGGPGGAGGQYVANIAAATTATPAGVIPGGGGAGGKTGLQLAGNGAHGRIIVWA